MLEFEDGKSYAQLTYDELYYLGFMEGSISVLISMALYKGKKSKETHEETLMEMVEEEYGSMDMVYEIRAFHKKYPKLNKKQLRAKLIKESEYKFI